jgi:hypothetical protein
MEDFLGTNVLSSQTQSPLAELIKGLGIGGEMVVGIALFASLFCFAVEPTETIRVHIWMTKALIRWAMNFKWLRRATV